MTPVTEVTEDSKTFAFDECILKLINIVAVADQEVNKTKYEIKITQNKLKTLEQDLEAYSNVLSEAQSKVLIAIMEKVQRSGHEIN